MRNQKAFAAILGAVEKMKAGNTFSEDANFWKLEGDKAKNGRAVIRFLPAKDDDSVPFVKTFNHGFQGDSGKWFIESCPTTIGKDCPVCASNGELVAANGGKWDQVPKTVQEFVRKRKRKVSYIANILVIEDPLNPDNEGKVFLWKFGEKIFDKIVDKMKPQFEDEAALNPFDAIEGANFKLKMRQVDGYANFDKSEFDSASEIENADKIISQLHDLNYFTDAKNFKSYDDLAEKFESVSKGKPRQTNVNDDDDDDDDDKLGKKPTSSKEPKRDLDDEELSKVETRKPTKQVVKDDDDDDDLEYFKKLASED